MRIDMEHGDEDRPHVAGRPSASHGQADANADQAYLSMLQRSAGNAAVARLLTSAGTATARPAGCVAHAFLDESRSGAEEFQARPIGFEPAGPDPSPAPINEDGLIDGDWISVVAATVFVNAGKAGTGLVNWAGGNGGTTPGIGGSTAVAPVIDTGPAGDGGTARAWVRAGTGTVNVRRHYFGVPVGANGPYFITAAAAARIDTHEQNHISHSRLAHDAHIVPLEARVAARTGEAKALSQGADEAAAKAALIAELKWNDALTRFRNQDNTDNLPGGTVDTADSASAGWYKDLGPKTVAGVNYAHYVDV